VSLLRRGPASSEAERERKQKAELRAVRLERTREARAATRMMVAPEHKYGIYVSIVLVLVAVYSFLSTDVGQVNEPVHGKAHYVQATLPPHPAQAIVLLIFALAAAATIYWRRRLVSGLSYIVTGFFAIQTPLPKAASDLAYFLFLVPAGYAFWMLMFRMNKEQKAWLNEHYPPAGGTAAAATRNSTRRAAASGGPARSSRGSSASAGASRAAQIRSGRYTPPRAKTKSAPRKS